MSVVRRRAGIALALIAVVLLAIVWFLRREGDVPAVATARVATPALAPDESPLRDDAHAATSDARRSSPEAPREPRDVEIAAAPNAALEASISGFVLDAARKPIARKRSARVDLIDDSGRRRASDTSGDGAYAFHELPLGGYWLTARASGFRDVDARVEPTAETPRVRRDFELTLAPVIKVRVVTPEGGELAIGIQGKGKARRLLAVATREHPGTHFFEVSGSFNNPFGVGSFWNHGEYFEG